MWSTLRVCLTVLVISLCLTEMANGSYVDCEMECLFAAFRKPTLCKCSNPIKLHWGKRAPRPRQYGLPTFRYGKRDSPFSNQGLSNEIDDTRFETLNAVRQALQTGVSDYVE